MLQSACWVPAIVDFVLGTCHDVHWRRGPASSWASPSNMLLTYYQTKLWKPILGALQVSIGTYAISKFRKTVQQRQKAASNLGGQCSFLRSKSSFMCWCYIKPLCICPAIPSLSLKHKREIRIKKVRWIDLEIWVWYFKSNIFILS